MSQAKTHRWPRIMLATFRLLILATLVTLAFAGAAWAACGSILWEWNLTLFQDMLGLVANKKAPSFVTDSAWTRVDGFDSREDCLKALNAKKENYLSHLDGYKMPDGRHMDLRWQCWPVGEDPRTHH